AGPAKGPIDPKLIAFMESVGHDLGSPDQSISTDAVSWRDYDVIVSLEGKVGDYVPEVPVGTVAFDWPVSPLPKGSDGDGGEAAYRAAYEEVAGRLRGLIETMRGLEEDGDG
ncbi:MAG: hypothetical protein R3282_08430, partial [Rhodothermales bacterium]|nr:hypothetical protein [Rhodothermales bacterium]